MKAITPGETGQLLADWRRDPLEAFMGYASSAEFRASSASKRKKKDLGADSLLVYRTMFGRLLTPTEN